MSRNSFPFVFLCLCFAAASWLVIVEPELPLISPQNAANCIYLIGFFPPFIFRTIQDFPIAMKGKPTISRQNVFALLCLIAVLFTIFSASTYAEFGCDYWAVFVQTGFVWILVFRVSMGKSIYFFPNIKRPERKIVQK